MNYKKRTQKNIYEHYNSFISEGIPEDSNVMPDSPFYMQKGTMKDYDVHIAADIGKVFDYLLDEKSARNLCIAVFLCMSRDNNFTETANSLCDDWEIETIDSVEIREDIFKLSVHHIKTILKSGKRYGVEVKEFSDLWELP